MTRRRSPAGRGGGPGRKNPTGGSRSAARPSTSKGGGAPPGVRLQKYLSDLGLGSRRGIEQWIAEGRVRVNGRPAELGQRVVDGARITVDGRPVQRRQGSVRNTRVLVYNKPEGEICTRDDPADRPTVFRHLPRLKGARWVAVGRLDINTRGLLLFTSNGDLANRLMLPETGLEREYLCRVFGDVSPAAIETLLAGVDLGGETVAFREIQRQRGEGRNTWYRVVVTEGRYREVRRLWEAVDCRVSRLVRVRYGPVKLARSLRQGEWTELSAMDVSALCAAAGLDAGDAGGGRARKGTKPRRQPRRGGSRR